MSVLLFKAQTSLLHNAALASQDKHSLSFLSALAALCSAPLLCQGLHFAVIN